MLACHWYIELNPVRAGMASSAAAYAWSSFRGNTGQAPDETLSEHPEYTALASEPAARHAAYRRFCEVENDGDFLAAIRTATGAGLPLVGESLKSKLVLDGSRTERKKPGPRGQADKRRRERVGQLEL